MNLKISTACVLCTLCLCIGSISGYKVLGIFPFFSPSHYFLGNELMKGLAKAGHDVTIMTIFEEKNPPKNVKYKHIMINGVLEEQKVMFTKMANLSQPGSVKKFFANPFVFITKFPEMVHFVTELTLKSKKMQELIKSKEQFDVLIVPQFGLEAIKGLAPHLGAHLVLFNNNAMNSWMGHFVGYPSLPSIDSEVLLGYIGQMNFQQRLLNTFLKMLGYFANTFFIYPDHNELIHKYISADIDLTKAQYNVSLVLSNSHSSLNEASGSVPVIKEIGGFHVRPPKKLPENLQKYLDEAKDGVIYFSLGSNLKGADLPIEIRKDLMKAFSKRKENILWKFENDDMPGKPANVRIEKWLPQSDILAHPNVKLFITHGGFLSTIETVYHGVPTIAIPILADQLKNAKSAEAHGYTFIVDYNDLNEKAISLALEEVLSNNKYLKNVKYRSKIFHDRQIKPLDEAVYWIEYIVRHNGANHLRVNYINLAWYEYYLVDVLAVMIAVIFLAVFIIKKLVFGIFGLCIGKSDKKSKKIKTK